MPPPVSYLDINTIPFTAVISQADFNAGTYGGIANEIWFRFPLTGELKLAFGGFCDKGGTFIPLTQAFDSDGTTFLRAQVVSDFAWYAIIDATTDKYVRIAKSGGGASDFDFTVNFDTKICNDPAAVIENGDILENDDEGGPGVLMNSIGEIKTFFDPFPSGEYGALLPNNISLWDGDQHGAGRYELYNGLDYVLSLSITGQFNICASDTQFFMCKHSGNPHTIYQVDDDGTAVNIGSLPVIAPNVNITGFGCNRAGTILYWTKQSGDAVVHRWDVATALPLSDLYTIPGFDTVADRVSTTEFNNGGEISCLPDDSLLLWWTDASLAKKIILHIDSTGTLIDSFDASPIGLNHFAYIKDSTNSIRAWYLADGDSGLNTYGTYDVLTDTLSSTFSKRNFSTGVNETQSDPTIFGPATSCQFITFVAAEGSITVIKVTDPSGVIQEFDFNTSGGLSPSSFSLSDGEVQEYLALAAGTYGVTEVAVTGFTISYDVSNGDPHTAIILGDGDNVIVTVTNTLLLKGGIYKIVPGKRNDTLWLDNFVGTEDVKIP